MKWVIVSTLRNLLCFRFHGGWLVRLCLGVWWTGLTLEMFVGTVFAIQQVPKLKPGCLKRWLGMQALICYLAFVSRFSGVNLRRNFLFKSHVFIPTYNSILQRRN